MRVCACVCTLSSLHLCCVVSVNPSKQATAFPSFSLCNPGATHQAPIRYTVHNTPQDTSQTLSVESHHQRFMVNKKWTGVFGG